MTILGLLLIIALIGLATWLLTTYVPMNPPIQKLVVAAAIIIIVLIIMQAIGLLSGGLGTVPRVR